MLEAFADFSRRETQGHKHQGHFHCQWMRKLSTFLAKLPQLFMGSVIAAAHIVTHSDISEMVLTYATVSAGSIGG